jgi:DNA-binding NtrC family response regulator
MILDEIAARFPEVPVVVLTVINDLSTAVECMRAGAVDYLVKPVEPSRLASSLRRALGARQQRSPAAATDDARRHTGGTPTECGAIITQNRTMIALFRDIEAIASSPQPVLVTGESGTGKELVAQAVHRLSHRSGTLVTVNVAGLDDTLFADTLFGHTRGAFTGAERGRDGLLETAAGGTIFLDEIGELSAASQVKLLRLLQDGAYYPLGADRPRRSGARVVAATNCDVSDAVATGQFRRDLYCVVTRACAKDGLTS